MPIYGDSYIVNIKDIIKDIMLSILRTYMGMPIFGNVHIWACFDITLLTIMQGSPCMGNWSNKLYITGQRAKNWRPEASY